MVVKYKGRLYNNKVKFEDIKKAFPKITEKEFEEIFKKKVEKPKTKKEIKKTKKVENTSKHRDNTDLSSK